MAESELLVEMAQNDMTCPVVAALTPTSTPLSPKSDAEFTFGGFDSTAGPNSVRSTEANGKRFRSSSGCDDDNYEAQCATTSTISPTPDSQLKSDETDGGGDCERERVAIAELFWGPQFARTLTMFSDRRAPSAPVTVAIGRNPNGRALVDVDLGHSSFISRLHLELVFEPTPAPSSSTGREPTPSPSPVPAPLNTSTCALTPKVSPDRVAASTTVPSASFTSTSSSFGLTTDAHTSDRNEESGGAGAVAVAAESPQSSPSPRRLSSCAPAYSPLNAGFGSRAERQRPTPPPDAQEKKENAMPTGTFSLRVIGKNGVFVNDVFVGRETAPSPLPGECAHPILFDDFFSSDL